MPLPKTEIKGQMYCEEYSNLHKSKLKQDSVCAHSTRYSAYYSYISSLVFSRRSISLISSSESDSDENILTNSK